MEFIDEDALYTDIRAAETTQEQGEVMMRYLLTGNNAGYEPEVEDPTWYEQEIVPRIEQELGVTAPETEVLRYEDGGQLVYDASMAQFENPSFLEYLGRDAERMLPEHNGRIGRAVNSIMIQANAAITNTIMDYLGTAVAGMADPYAEHLSDQAPDRQVIAYSVPGIENMAHKSGESVEDVKEYVMTHEGIHSVQMAEYDSLLENRRQSVADMMNLVKDPQTHFLKRLMEKDLIELAENPAGTMIEEVFGGPDLPSMTLMEGHAEFYTDRIFDTPLRTTKNQDTDEPEDLVGSILKETVFKSKEAQYRDGKAFFDTIHDHGGNAYVQYTMEHPPTDPDVFTRPEAWINHIEKELA